MKRNKLLLIAFIIGLAYLVYLIAYFSGAVGSSTGTEQAGAAIATAMVTPHMICVLLAVIFNGLGYFKNAKGFALTGAILYAVAMVIFLPYFIFVVLEMILSFIGYAQIKNY